jgi:hypothetical protein
VVRSVGPKDVKIAMGSEEQVLVVCNYNFTGIVKEDCRIALPSTVPIHLAFDGLNMVYAVGRNDGQL